MSEKVVWGKGLHEQGGIAENTRQGGTARTWFAVGIVDELFWWT